MENQDNPEQEKGNDDFDLAFENYEIKNDVPNQEQEGNQDANFQNQEMEVEPVKEPNYNYDGNMNMESPNQYNNNLDNLDNVNIEMNQPNDNQNYDEKNQQIQEVQMQQQQEQPPENFIDNFNLSKSSHPLICVFHFLFKTAALLCFFLIGSDHGVLTFVTVIIFSSMDFWFTKNISGRLLIGLRYWSTVEDNGDIVWVFESPNTKFKSNAVDLAFFWFFLIGFEIFWIFILILELLTFSFFWFLLSFVVNTLHCINILGYYRCRGEHKKKMNNFATNGLQAVGRQLFANAIIK